MSREEQSESPVRFAPLGMEISLQKLKRGRNNLPVPEAVNYYEGVATFGKKTKFRKVFTREIWRSFWWRFDLGGFAEMCFLDPDHFDGSNYELKYIGEEKIPGALYWVYQVTHKDRSKGWQFRGTVWVLPEELTIIRFEGAFHPMRKIHWPIPVEDYWFHFDSRRREISPGVWVPDFTCTDVDVAKRDAFEPAFRARILYSNEDEWKPSANSESACGMQLGHFPAEEIEQDRNSGVSPK